MMTRQELNSAAPCVPLKGAAATAARRCLDGCDDCIVLGACQPMYGVMKNCVYNYIFRVGKTNVKLYMACTGPITVSDADATAAAAALCEPAAKRAMRRLLATQ